MIHNKETNLEQLIDILLKMVDSNEKHYTQGIDEVKTIVETQNEFHKKEVNDLKQTISKCVSQIDEINKDLEKTAIDTAVKEVKYSLKGRFLIAGTTLMIATAPLFIKFNKEIITFIIKLLK